MRGKVNATVYLPAAAASTARKRNCELNYLGSELSDLGSELSGLFEELPRSGMESVFLFLLTPSFSAVLSSKTPVAGRLLDV